MSPQVSSLAIFSCPHNKISSAQNSIHLRPCLLIYTIKHSSNAFSFWVIFSCFLEKKKTISRQFQSETLTYCDCLIGFRPSITGSVIWLERQNSYRLPIRSTVMLPESFEFSSGSEQTIWSMNLDIKYSSFITFLNLTTKTWVCACMHCCY